MAVLIDPPVWPAHGRLWSHLASDTSFDELHAFATTAGVPRRAFEGDHYDVPQERYADLVGAGARPVASRDLLRALQGSGLRRPKRKGERVLYRWVDGDQPADLLLSPLGPPAPAERTLGLAVRDGRLALVDGALPEVVATAGHPLGHLRARDADGRRRYVALRRVASPPDGSVWTPVAEARGASALERWWPLLVRFV